MARANTKKRELLEVVAQSIQDCGWIVLFTSPLNSHPFSLCVFNEGHRVDLKVYIWNLTPGGNNRPKDEWRIQPTSTSKFLSSKGEITLILGWKEDLEIFVAFDLQKHSGLIGASSSFQIKEYNLTEALINGASVYKKGNQEAVVAFRKDFFVEYILNYSDLHDLIYNNSEFEIFDEISKEDKSTEVIDNSNLSSERKIIYVNIKKKLRDNSFKARVLNAYGNRCAFSGTQLKLVDAAHILPVKISASTDETNNGISLSVIYHRAYDNGLVTFDENFKIIVNKNSVEKLKMTGLDGGIDRFIEALRSHIIIPPSVADRPNKNFIRESNKLRGWNF